MRGQAESPALDNGVMGNDTDMAPIAVSCPSDQDAVLGKRKHATESAGVLLVENAATQPLLSTMQRCAALQAARNNPRSNLPPFQGRPASTAGLNRASKHGARWAHVLPGGLMSKSASQV